MNRTIVFLALVAFYSAKCMALESLLPKWNLGTISSKKTTPNIAVISPKARQLEDELLRTIQEQGSRLSNSERIIDLVQQLETLPSIPEPAVAPQIYGKWRLLYTTNADTSSPIQRKAVDAQAFKIYQNIIIVNNNQQQQQQLVVSQVVQFSDQNQLRVDALASTAAYPFVNFDSNNNNNADTWTERQSTGKILGLNILGVSLVGQEAQEDPNRPNARIQFVFDEGEFDLFGGRLKVPYPVPFRNPLFRDWVKGWIDITWLSDRVRISRGNKGTAFVLIKEE